MKKDSFQMGKLPVVVAFVVVAGTACNRGVPSQTASAASAAPTAPQARSNPMEIEANESLMQRQIGRAHV